MKTPLTLLLLSLALMGMGSAHAARADADQPTTIEADQMLYDDVRQINTFTGNVLLVRGSLTLRSARMVVTQDPAGYQYATLYAAPGKPASFRQKRDGGEDLWIEGEGADRIEYDTKTEVAKFYLKAQIRLLDGKTVTDEVHGDFISYDSKAEFFTVNNTTSGASKPGSGRIKAIIQPRTKQDN